MVSKKKKAEQLAQKEAASKALIAFTANHKMQDAVQNYLLYKNLSPDLKEKYVQIFKAMDSDGNEDLDRQEIFDNKDKFLLDPADIMTDDDIENFINLADVNGDDSIDLEEFIEGARKWQAQAAEVQLKEAFEFFDQDKSGTIESSEMLNALSFLEGFDEEKAASIIAKYDDNGDGLMDYLEFMNFVNMDESFK